MEPKTLVDEIDGFSAELRRAAILKSGRNGTHGSAHEGSAKRDAATADKLRAYFDEFSRQRPARGGRKSIADCYHGKVIRAIRDGFHSSAEALKNRAIDLTMLTSGRAFLFEAKTSADTRSIYTAIGQRVVHASKIEMPHDQGHGSS